MPDELENVEQFARNLASQCHTHKEWLVVMQYGMGTLLSDQRLLLMLIDAEARREVQRGAQDNYELLPLIFSDLGLRIALND